MLRASLPVVDIWKAPQLSGNPRLPAHIPVLILAQVIIRPTPTKEKRRPSTQATHRGQAEMGFVSVTPPYGNARDARDGKLNACLPVDATATKTAETARDP